MGIQIAPSILSADFVNLERDINEVSSADWLHVDVMDGHFVPNLTLGLPVLERIAQISPLPVDAHLMIEDADHWAPRYAEAGAASVTFHAEAAKDPVAIARDLRSLHTRASIALKPGTPVEPYLEMLEEFDMLLIMTVEHGFGGQEFMADMMAKIEAVRRHHGQDSLWIEVDGGIDRKTAPIVAAAGANVLVAGSAVYGAQDRNAEIVSLRAAAQGAHHH